MSKKGENNETLLPIPFLDGGKESGASIRRAKKLDMYSDSKVKNEGLEQIQLEIPQVSGWSKFDMGAELRRAYSSDF
jgi:hypothetical protein